MNYAQHATNAILQHIANTENKIKVNRIHQADIQAHNLRMLAKCPDYATFTAPDCYCQCYGCRHKISPTASNDCTAGEAVELVKAGKLFCTHCQEFQQSVGFNKLLECFPKAFIVGKHKTDTARLNQPALTKLTKWTNENIINGNSMESLYLCGDTGAGKSRMMTIIALQCLEYGITLNTLRGGGFTEKLREYNGNTDYARAREQEARWLNNLKRCEVLILDDFGREELTPTMAEKYWSLIDARLGNRTTIFVSNFMPADLPILDESIKRRIRDYCALLKIEK